MVTELDPRLRALLPVIDELKALRSYLEGISNNRTDGVTFAPEIAWIDGTLSRIEPQMHTRWWPPIGWRLRKEDVDLLHRNIHRVDSEGAYFDRSRPGHDSAYIPEREKILEWIDRIDKMCHDARQVK